MDFAKILATLSQLEKKQTLTESAKKEKKVDEEDTQEGNEFSGELAKAKAAGKKDFEVDGKKYQVKESDDSDKDEEKEDDKETIEESELKEKAAPGQEDWIKSNKEKFIKQYGKKKGMEVLYATSWKRSKKNESIERISECYDQAMMGGQQEQESGMNINASTDTRTGSKSLTVTAQGQAAEQLAQLLKLSGIAGPANAGHDAEMEEAAYVNQPDPQVQGVEVQMQQGTDLNRPKNSYPKVSGGDNPMNMREAEELRALERRLNEELAAFKVVAEGSRVKEPSGNYRDPHTGRLYSSPDGKDGNDGYRTPEYMLDFYKKKLAQIAAGPYKRTKEVAQLRAKIAKLEKQGVAEGKGKKPDFLDMDKDGNKKEPMKKALKDKGDKPVKEGKKPDFLDMDKDGNKKEPMKKALADKKHKK